MKKVMALFIVLSFILVLLSACFGRESDAPIKAPLLPTVYPTILPVTEPDPSLSFNLIEPESEESSKINEGEDTGIDVDLTALSSTMVYGEVFNMMMNPDNYIGKTIKVCGLYYASYYEATEQYYHFVIIQDATACCAQGLEFRWESERVYPEDYPQNDTEIDITGVWESYEEDGQTWYRLSVPEE